MIRAYFEGPSCLTVSLTGMCYGLPSTISAGLGAISNATARRRHYAEDVVLRLIVTVAGLGKPSALPTVEQSPAGVLAVVESTQRGL
jgi:hypothetical protein